MVSVVNENESNEKNKKVKSKLDFPFICRFNSLFLFTFCRLLRGWILGYCSSGFGDNFDGYVVTLAILKRVKLLGKMVGTRKKRGVPQEGFDIEEEKEYCLGSCI